MKASDSPQIEVGKDRPVVDGIGWVVGIPNKIILWNHKVDNHNVSPETREKIDQHLSYYGLHDTKVRINQYDPAGEWQRLRDNQHMHPGWKYTMGSLHTLGYTIFPGRIFGNDQYNPYTNTVNIYSDVPSIGMTETAYAYDVQTRNNPGLYSFSQDIPLLDMWHHDLSTDRTITHLEKYGTAEELKEAYHVLYPRYGVNLGGGVGSYVGASGIFELGGALAGHAYGRYESSQVNPYKTVENTPAQDPATIKLSTTTPDHSLNPSTEIIRGQSR
jgi:hypothetical protein